MIKVEENIIIYDKTLNSYKVLSAKNRNVLAIVKFQQGAIKEEANGLVVEDLLRIATSQLSKFREEQNIETFSDLILTILDLSKKSESSVEGSQIIKGDDIVFT
jgi:hypothetical protein